MEMKKKNCKTFRIIEGEKNWIDGIIFFFFLSISIMINN